MTQTECDPAVTRIADGAELPAPGRWQIDPGHTELAFIGRHFMLTKVRGRFTGLSGVIEVAERPLQIALGRSSCCDAVARGRGEVVWA
jgi:hypothetical protein